MLPQIIGLLFAKPDIHLCYNYFCPKTLAKKLDDIINCIKAAIERMDLYNIEEPSDRIREMSELILKCGKQVEKAIFSLQDISKRLGLRQVPWGRRRKSMSFLLKTGKGYTL